MGFNTLFDFEQDFAKAFQCIPMVVRYKLDLCGIKLSLRQWTKFTEEDRRDLLQRECKTAAEITQFREMLTALISSRAGETAVALPIEAAPAWVDLDAVPDQIIAYAKTQGIEPLTLAEWQSISVLQRFVLLKLSRESHDNVNFVPALKEFKLLPA